MRFDEWPAHAALNARPERSELPAPGPMVCSTNTAALYLFGTFANQASHGVAPWHPPISNRGQPASPTPCHCEPSKGLRIHARWDVPFQRVDGQPPHPTPRGGRGPIVALRFWCSRPCWSPAPADGPSSSRRETTARPTTPGAKAISCNSVVPVKPSRTHANANNSFQNTRRKNGPPLIPWRTARTADLPILNREASVQTADIIDVSLAWMAPPKGQLHHPMAPTDGPQWCNEYDRNRSNSATRGMTPEEIAWQRVCATRPT